jgi:16S rRNA (cytosine967-C5)-methyltransferase
MNAVEKLAGEIICRSVETSADTVLRDTLRTSKMPREQTATVADLVFSYFRWRGWLNAAEPLEQQFTAVRELETRLAQTPDSFTTEELAKAVPDWTREEVSLERDWLLALQARPALWLRTKHGTASDVAAKLGDCVEGRGALRDSLEYRGAKDLFRTPEFHAGEFEVQDIASQIVGLLCEPKPGETWWDACAGEGGKTLHLSDLMQNKGLIWATDRSERRLVRLKQRAARAKAFNYRAAAWDGAARLPTKTKFDGVLIDAPCSGVGTWQRNPHARWTTTRDDVNELGKIQQQLVMNAAAAVKPGGKLIYAVCTLTRTETDAVADFCSEQLRGFTPFSASIPHAASPNAAGRTWIWPQAMRGNGMFVAAWRRDR